MKRQAFKITTWARLSHLQLQALKGGASGGDEEDDRENEVDPTG